MKTAVHDTTGTQMQMITSMMTTIITGMTICWPAGSGVR